MKASLKDRLVGTWKLESYVERPVDGSPEVYPLGTDATGVIIYTSDGYMSAQLMRQGRPLFASGDWFEGTSEEYCHAASYIAYSGVYRVYEQRQTLTHSMYVSFFPNWGGQTQSRTVELVGDILRLSTASPIRSNGKMVMSYLQWRRAGR